MFSEEFDKGKAWQPSLHRATALVEDPLPAHSIYLRKGWRLPLLNPHCLSYCGNLKNVYQPLKRQLCVEKTIFNIKIKAIPRATKKGANLKGKKRLGNNNESCMLITSGRNIL